MTSVDNDEIISGNEDDDETTPEDDDDDDEDDDDDTTTGDDEDNKGSGCLNVRRRLTLDSTGASDTLLLREVSIDDDDVDGNGIDNDDEDGCTNYDDG